MMTRGKCVRVCMFVNYRCCITIRICLYQLNIHRLALKTHHFVVVYDFTIYRDNGKNCSKTRIERTRTPKVTLVPPTCTVVCVSSILNISV